jgi:DNA-binding winged helix-turn-helix (wHTH) protein
LIDSRVTLRGLSAGTALRGASFIALIGCANICESALMPRLRSLGHFPVSFDSISEYLKAARGGARFDLVMSSLQEHEQWRELLLACLTYELPVVLLAQEFQSTMLAEALVTAREKLKCLVDVSVATLPILDTELAHWAGLSARSSERPSAGAPAADRQFGSYRFIVSRRRVSLRQLEVQLMPQEFEVALLLFENAGRLIERDMILRLIWGKRANDDRSRVVDVCASRLRKKLSLCEDNGFELVSIYKRGYELRHVAMRSDAENDAHCERVNFLEPSRTQIAVVDRRSVGIAANQ